MPVIVQQRSEASWRVTLENPPLNLFDPQMIAGLQRMIEHFENDDKVKVIVLDSANR